MSQINESKKSKMKCLKIPVLMYLIGIIVISVLSACFVCERINMTDYLSYYRTSLMMLLVNIISFMVTVLFLYALIWIITGKKFRIKELFKCIACIGIIYTGIILMIDMFLGYFIEKMPVILFLKFAYHFFTVYICLLYVNNECEISIAKNVMISLFFIILNTTLSIVVYFL